MTAEEIVDAMDTRLTRLKALEEFYPKLPSSFVAENQARIDELETLIEYVLEKGVSK